MTDISMRPGALVETRGLSKTFVLHNQGGAEIPVLRDLDFHVLRGECVALAGPSGTGKSTLLRSLYANYKPQAGSVAVLHLGRAVDLARADPRTVLDVRRRTLGYVSQFLRVIPRVACLDIVAAPLTDEGLPRAEARERAGALLARLNIPARLWGLAPSTFSGGEQQRVNIARGFIKPCPVLLLDEPTASLDAHNRAVVMGLIHEAKTRGTAVVGIFHDEEVRDAVADRLYPMQPIGNMQ